MADGGAREFSASSRPLDLNGEAARFKWRIISATIAADVKRFWHQIKPDKAFQHTRVLNGCLSNPQGIGITNAQLRSCVKNGYNGRINGKG
jgi:hypothetical protein